MNLAIQTKDLSKVYKGQFALDKVSILVNKKDIYGLVGPNGAGKTSFMKIICGLARQTAGKFCILGLEETSKETMPFFKMGSLIETPAFFPNMNAFDNLMLKCLALGIDNPKEHIRELLELVDLTYVNKKKTCEFSLGMRQRLGLAMALVASPEILVLDEPVNGLDPQGIAEIRNLILRINRDKDITIIVSSHILPELSKIASMYGILDRGKLIYEGSKDELEKECESKGLSFENFYLQITQGASQC